MARNPLKPEEEEKRLDLYRQGLSDTEIARICKLKTGGAIARWRVRRGLPPNKKKSFIKGVSLCESCVHAYGDDCFSVPFEHRFWVKEAEFKKVTFNTKKEEVKKEIIIRKIRECEKYKRGRRNALSPKSIEDSLLK